MTRSSIKIAYIHNIKYPSAFANAIQAIKTASALSTLSDTTFFMPGLKTSKSELKEIYDISTTPLHLQSMYLDKLPDRVKLKIENCYERFLSIYLQVHPKWAGFRGKKVLFVRTLEELLFWGLKRESSKWLKDWNFIFEAHDALGLDPSEFGSANPFDLKAGTESQYRQRLLTALRSFDHVVCVTQALADDLASWTDHAIQPQVVNHASFLPHLEAPPQIAFGENIVLGYIGTIDRFRGVDILLNAMKYLPQNYKLRLVGRLRHEEEGGSDWFDTYMKNPIIKSKVEYVPAVPIKEVAGEIDRCHILLQPASNDAMYSRYASPLKGYDPMMRGKPILAADIPGHHDLYNNGKSASFYRLDPHSLAESITDLVNNPDHAEKIARAGWEQAAEYTYLRRAEKIISLVEGHSGK